MQKPPYMLLLYRKKREKSTHGFWYERQCFETEGKIGRAGKNTAKKVLKNAKTDKGYKNGKENLYTCDMGF